MQLKGANPSDVWRVARLMRESDYRELSAIGPAQNRVQLADHLTNRFGRADCVIVAYDQDKAVAVGAPIEARPGVITLVFWATDEWAPIAGDLTKWISRLLRDLRANGVHRIEAIALADHHEARRWLEFFGLSPEGPPTRGYGRNGETYQHYAWVSDACPPSP